MFFDARCNRAILNLQFTIYHLQSVELAAYRRSKLCLPYRPRLEGAEPKRRRKLRSAREPKRAEFKARGNGRNKVERGVESD